MTQTAFLQPVVTADGTIKARSIAARITSRLLCSQPSELTALLTSAQASSHETKVAGKGHLDREHGCYSCHVTLDPIASVFHKNFMSAEHQRPESEVTPYFGGVVSMGVYGGSPTPGDGFFMGQPVRGVRQLADSLAQSRSFARCTVQKAFENLFGRQVSGPDAKFIDQMTTRFMSSEINYDYINLLREIVASSEFLRRD